MFCKDYEYIVNKIHKAKIKSIQVSFIFYTLYLIVVALLFAASNILLSIYSNFLLDIVLSYVFGWLIFFSLFKLSVNRKIDNKAAIISSLSTFVVLAVTKNLFIYYVIYNKTYATIYGSLATLLFTFFWIYISWIIYLYGIKMCHRLNIQEQFRKNNLS